MSGLCFELARLTGKETRRDSWLGDKGQWGRSASEICSHLDAIGFDSLQCFLRLPVDSCGSFSWRTIKYHCQVADQSQSFYRCVSPEQWLLTLVQSSRPAEIFDSSEDDLIIHSNVLPRQAYLKAPCLKHQHCTGFFPANAIVDGLEIPNSQSCENCALAEHMRRNDGMPVDELENLLRFWFLEVEEVDLVDELGEGSEGKVSKIRWRKGVFARKRFYCEGLSEQNVNMNRELDVALRVSHPNIVHCFGCSRWADSADCDLFMELLEVDLDRFVREKKEAGSDFPFSFRDSLDVLLQVAQAMQHVHEKNFVHGDLKPQNIFMSRFELAHSGVQYYLVKVGDFGCAQRVDTSGATVEPFRSGIGTLRYTAPEVLRCRKHGAPPEYPQKIDVYSFGVVAYQVLTGVAEIYEGRRNSSITKEVIEGQLRPDSGVDVTLDADRSSLLHLIQKCWTSDPGDRPSFSHICAELDCLVKRDREFWNRNAKRKRHSIGDSVKDCNLHAEQQRSEENMLLGVG